MSESKNWMKKCQSIAVENDYAISEPDIEITDIVPEPEQTTMAVENKIGTVIDCPRLNVRVKPHTDADVVCIIERDSKVVIDEENSTKNFYKICTEVGVEGYCMKRFINILT